MVRDLATKLGERAGGTDEPGPFQVPKLSKSGVRPARQFTMVYHPSDHVIDCRRRVPERLILIPGSRELRSDALSNSIHVFVRDIPKAMSVDIPPVQLGVETDMHDRQQRT
jgi:hypothetical protein